MQDKKTKNSINYRIVITVISMLLSIATVIFVKHPFGLTTLVLLDFLIILIIWVTYSRELNVLRRLELAEDDPNTLIKNFFNTLTSPLTDSEVKRMSPQAFYAKAIEECVKKKTPPEIIENILNEINIQPGGSTLAIFEAIESLNPSYLELLLKKGGTNANYANDNYDFLHHLINQLNTTRNIFKTDPINAKDFINTLRVLIRNGIDRSKDPNSATALNFFNKQNCDPALKPPQITEIAKLLDPNIPLEELELRTSQEIANESKPQSETTQQEDTTEKPQQ